MYPIFKYFQAEQIYHEAIRLMHKDPGVIALYSCSWIGIFNSLKVTEKFQKYNWLLLYSKPGMTCRTRILFEHLFKIQV